MGKLSDFIFGGSKITVNGDWSHEIERCLLLGRKVMTNLDSIFKSRDITLLTKVCLVKAMVFPVVMYGCESWIIKKNWVAKNKWDPFTWIHQHFNILGIQYFKCNHLTWKKAEWWKVDASELWCWRRLLRVPWTARRSNQSILTEISPECSLEGLMLKLKLQYFGYLMWRVDSLEKISMEKTEDEMAGCHHRLDGREFEWTLGVADGLGGLACCNSWGCKESDSTERLNWTEAQD